MKHFRKTKEWLSIGNNANVFGSISACIIGIAALIVSITNAGFVRQQTRINQVLLQLQIEERQPYYTVSTYLEMDSTDGVYGTEHLIITNHGFANVSSTVNETVLFELVRYKKTELDTIRFKVDDYFCVNFHGSVNDEYLIYHSFDKGNNRRFFNLYLEALNDRETDTRFFLDKTILVKIYYSDILGDNHSKYYIDKTEVQEQKFMSKLENVQVESCNLFDLKYEKMKEVFGLEYE